MVAIEVILSRIQVPTSHIFTINTIEVIVTNVAAPVILCQECSVWLLPCLVLYICGNKVLRKSWEGSIPDICPRVWERDIIKTPKRSELAESRKSAVDKVLVRSVKPIVNDPMEVALDSTELYVDVVGALVNKRS